MSRRRSARQSAFSLFSFQDIITSVTGIMVLITLLLAVELINRTEASPPMQTREQLGIKQIYALGVDAAKQELFRNLGFQARAVLPAHYRVGHEYHDCELLEFVT